VTDDSAALDDAAAALHLAALKLTDFRNYARLAVAFDGRPVVLTGPNGAGKTNLMEAISFLSPGRGLRRATYDAVAAKAGDGGWAVAATLATPVGPVEIGTGIQLGPDGPERQRRILVNHAPARSAEALLDHLRVIWLTPAMDGLFTGAATDRRRFVDRLTLAIDRGHAGRVTAYERAMRGRNRLLGEASPDRRWLDALEQEMAELGVALAAARLESVALLAGEIAAEADDGPFPRAEIALAGEIEAKLATAAAGDVEDAFRAALRDGRPRDTAARRTLAGPHTADLTVRHQGRDMEAALCSTGEQKALLTGLILAHAGLTARLAGMPPLVLLDEVAAHLDETRRAALFERILALRCQAFLTGTDGAVFAPLGAKMQHFGVENAVLTPIG